MDAPFFFYTVIIGLWVLWAHYGGAAFAPGPDDPASDEQTQPAVA